MIARSPSVEPPGSTGDERAGSALLGRIQPGDRVAVIGESLVAEARIAALGARVQRFELESLVHPDSGQELLEAIVRFAPTLVLLVDGRDSPLPAAPLLVQLAPRLRSARIAVVAWSPVSPGVFLSHATAAHSPWATSETQARCLSRLAGLELREVSRFPEDLPLPIGAPVRQNLARLFRQISASTEERVIYWFDREPATPEAGKPRLQSGLLSVIIRHCNPRRLPLLDQAIFSLACQAYRPLEVILVVQDPAPETLEEVRRLLDRHRPLGGYSFQVIHSPSTEDIRGKLLNTGLDAARGRYVAFLDDDDVVYPRHYERLVTGLLESGAVWAVAPTRAGRFSVGPDGVLYCQTKHPLEDGQQLNLARFVGQNHIPFHSFVIDRQGLGGFPLRFCETITRLEDFSLLLRLASVFPPHFIRGEPSCEYRMRDDASNSAPEDGAELAWSEARRFIDELRGETAFLITARELDQQFQLHEASVRAHAPRGAEELRHRLADALNDTVRERLPRVHSLLKRLLAARFVGS